MASGKQPTSAKIPGTALQTLPAAKVPAKRGRPRTYTPEVADTICTRLAEGRLLNKICEAPGMPPASTVRQWVVDDVDGFAKKYLTARAAGCWDLFDYMRDVADDGRNDWMEVNGQRDRGWIANGENIRRSELRISFYKWALSKLMPATFGDKIEHTGAGGAPLAPPVINIVFLTTVTPAANDGSS